MDEYLTTAELSSRIKMAPGTIRNLVWKKTLKEGIHYIKPTPRKLLFIPEKIVEWLHQNNSVEEVPVSSKSKSLINI